MIDILDRLQDEEGYVRLVLHTGAIMYGMPDCIVFDEDENGDEVVKMLRFEPYGESRAVYYGLDDIAEYTRVKEEDIK